MKEQPPVPLLVPLLATPTAFYCYGDVSYSRPIQPTARGPPHFVRNLDVNVPVSNHVDAISRYVARRFGREFDDLMCANGPLPAERYVEPCHVPLPSAFVLGAYLKLPRTRKRFDAIVQFYDLSSDELAWARSLPPIDRVVTDFLY